MSRGSGSQGQIQNLRKISTFLTSAFSTLEKTGKPTISLSLEGLSEIVAYYFRDSIEYRLKHESTDEILVAMKLLRNMVKSLQWPNLNAMMLENSLVSQSMLKVCCAIFAYSCDSICRVLRKLVIRSLPIFFPFLFFFGKQVIPDLINLTAFHLAKHRPPQSPSLELTLAIEILIEMLRDPSSVREICKLARGSETTLRVLASVSYRSPGSDSTNTLTTCSRRAYLRAIHTLAEFGNHNCQVNSTLASQALSVALCVRAK